MTRLRSRRIFALGSLLLLGLLLLLPCTSALRLSSPTHSYSGYPSSHPEIGLYPHTFALYVESDPLSYNVSAPLVHLDSSTGKGLNDLLCFPLTTDQSQFVQGKVLMALRGGGEECRFFERTQRAKAAGAVALIIADNQSSDLTFAPQFLGPSPGELETEFPNTPLSDVQLPTIYILYSTYLQLTDLNGLTGQPNWFDTTASITSDGLVFTRADYEAMIAAATKYDGLAKAVTVGFPLVAALYCYAIWLGAMREARNSPQRQQQQQAAAPAAEQGGAQQGQAPPVAQQQQHPPSAADDAAQHAAAPRAVDRDGESVNNQFSEGEMQSLSLPVPPHLASGDTPADGSSSAVSSQSSSAGLIRGNSESHRSARSGSLADDEGALLGRAALSDELADHDLASPLPASGSNVGGNRSSGLGRPLLPLPVPSVALSQRVYYHLLKSLSLLGKPVWILRLNAAVYLVHAVIAIAVLFVAYGENCISNQTSMVSLWCARAMIGLRICYWQTHSNTFRPTCLDIFFKNWADCIFLFTGSLSSFSEAQKHDCELNAPITTRWVETWVLVIFVSYGSKLLLYGADRLTQHYGSRTPHLFAIASRSFLSVAQGGFSCAGALDAHQPATQLDLMLIPVVSFRDGMYPADDAVCGVCLGEYSSGEELRVLNCTHHFHKGCVDTWLQLKNTCPTCRSSIDSAVAQRRPSPQPPVHPPASRLVGIELNPGPACENPACNEKFKSRQRKDGDKFDTEKFCSYRCSDEADFLAGNKTRSRNPSALSREAEKNRHAEAESDMRDVVDEEEEVCDDCNLPIHKTNQAAAASKRFCECAAKAATGAGACDAAASADAADGSGDGAAASLPPDFSNRIGAFGHFAFLCLVNDLSDGRFHFQNTLEGCTWDGWLTELSTDGTGLMTQDGITVQIKSRYAGSETWQTHWRGKKKGSTWKKLPWSAYVDGLLAHVVVSRVVYDYLSDFLDRNEPLQKLSGAMHLTNAYYLLPFSRPVWYGSEHVTEEEVEDLAPFAVTLDPVIKIKYTTVTHSYQRTDQNKNTKTETDASYLARWAGDACWRITAGEIQLPAGQTLQRATPRIREKAEMLFRARVVQVLTEVCEDRFEQFERVRFVECEHRANLSYCAEHHGTKLLQVILTSAFVGQVSVCQTGVGPDVIINGCPVEVKCVHVGFNADVRSIRDALGKMAPKDWDNLESGRVRMLIAHQLHTDPAENDAHLEIFAVPWMAFHDGGYGGKPQLPLRERVALAQAKDYSMRLDSAEFAENFRRLLRACAEGVTLSTWRPYLHPNSMQLVHVDYLYPFVGLNPVIDDMTSVQHDGIATKVAKAHAYLVANRAAWALIQEKWSWEPETAAVASPVAVREAGVEMRAVRSERPPSPSRAHDDQDAESHYAYAAAEEV